MHKYSSQRHTLVGYDDGGDLFRGSDDSNF